MTDTSKRVSDSLMPEQRAEIGARVATWPKLTEAQLAQVAMLFGPHFGKRYGHASGDQ